MRRMDELKNWSSPSRSSPYQPGRTVTSDVQVPTRAAGTLDVASPRWTLCFHTTTFLSYLSSEEAARAQPRISYQLIFRLSPGSGRLKSPTERNLTHVPHLPDLAIRLAVKGRSSSTRIRVWGRFLHLVFSEYTQWVRWIPTLWELMSNLWISMTLSAPWVCQCLWAPSGQTYARLENSTGRNRPIST